MLQISMWYPSAQLDTTIRIRCYKEVLHCNSTYLGFVLAVAQAFVRLHIGDLKCFVVKQLNTWTNNATFWSQKTQMAHMVITDIDNDGSLETPSPAAAQH